MAQLVMMPLSKGRVQSIHACYWRVASSA